MPARGAHVREATRRLLERSPRYLDPGAFDETLTRHADLAHENTGEVPRTRRAAAGLRFDRQARVDALGSRPGGQRAAEAPGLSSRRSSTWVSARPMKARSSSRHCT